MKKIVEYRKLLNVEKTVALTDLKKIYRNAMKESHPDKFHGNLDGQAEAEAHSKNVIEAYHFLVSINPETINHQLPEYKETIATQAVVDYMYDAARLKIVFANGSVYEYISVPKAVYVKMVNADSPGRFAKRHVFSEFPYRKVSNQE